MEVVVDRSVKIRYLDGTRLRRAIVAGAKQVIAHAAELDRINVFPVADADTGRNLAATMGAIVRRLQALNTPHVGEVASSVAEAALYGARGNSGVIMAGFFQGLAEGLAGKWRVEVAPFAQAVRRAAERAWESLTAPKEGTVLSVLAAFARSLQEGARRLEDFVPLMGEGLRAAQEALRRTQETLPVLRRAGVVDAGALGFVRFLEGVVRLIHTGEVAEIELPPVAPVREDAVPEEAAPAFRYCVECAVKGEGIDPTAVKEALLELGDSVVVAGSRHILRLHVHTHLPAYVFEAARAFGHVADEKIDDMWRTTPPGPGEGVALVTDTACDLPPDLLTRHRIALVPIRVRLGEEDLRDRMELTPGEFYARLRGDIPAGTSQPPPGDFRDVFAYLGRVHAGVLGVFLAGGLSGTFGVGLQVARALRAEGLRIEVVDSGTISVGLGLVVLAAVAALKAGLDLEAAASLVREATGRVRGWAALPDLMPLARSGRIPWAAGWLTRRARLGMVVDITGGRISPVAPVFGRNLPGKLLSLARGAMRSMERPMAGVAHAATPSVAERLAAELSAAGATEVLVAPASPALGVHAGTGAVGVALLDRAWLEARIRELGGNPDVK
ncbi:DegV family protein [Candidatus Bipolaricaulota sp. J31]